MLKTILKERFEKLTHSANKGSMRAAVDEIHAILLHLVDTIDAPKVGSDKKQILLETGEEQSKPERKIHQVDVGSVTAEEAVAHINEIKEKFTETVVSENVPDEASKETTSEDVTNDASTTDDAEKKPKRSPKKAS